MKRTLQVLLSLLVFSFSALAQKYEVGFHPQPGDKYTYKITSHTPQTILAQGNKTQMKNSVVQVVSLHVVECKGSHFVVDTRVEKYELTQEANGNVMKISSEDPDNLYNREIKKYTQGVARAEINSAFELQGTPALVEGSGEAEDIFRIGIAPFAGLYPTHPLAVGESFAPKNFTALGTTKGSNDGNGLNGTITLEDVDNDYLVFSGKFEVETSSNGVTLRGPLTISYMIDRKKGLTHSGTATSSMEGSIPQYGASFQAQMSSFFEPIEK